MQKNVEQMKEKINNYPLFQEVEDAELRANNRGAMLANIFEDFGNGKGATTRVGLAAAMTYLSTVQDKGERVKAIEFMNAHLKSRGLV